MCEKPEGDPSCVCKRGAWAPMAFPDSATESRPPPSSCFLQLADSHLEGTALPTLPPWQPLHPQNSHPAFSHLHLTDFKALENRKKKSYLGVGGYDLEIPVVIFKINLMEIFFNKAILF